MFSTSHRQECICGRSFDDAGAFTRHKRKCLKGKKRLADVLSLAKESHHAKKCRIETSASSSHTSNETPDDHVLGPLDSLPDSMNATQSTKSGVMNEAGPVKGGGEVCVLFSFGLFDITPLEPSDIVQGEDNTLPLAIRRTQRVNRRLPKRFRDILPEPPLPLPPQDAEVFLEVNPLQANSSSPSTIAATPVIPISQPSLQADSIPQLAQLPYKRCGVFATQKNSFGLFRLFDDDSIPINDPEDQSGADPLPTLRVGAPVSQPLPTEPVNFFHPYPNESSWRIGDWYWNQGAQKSKQNFKSLMEIMSPVRAFSLKTCVTPIGLPLTVNWAVWGPPMTTPKQSVRRPTCKNGKMRTVAGCGELSPFLFHSLDAPYIQVQEAMQSLIFIVALFFQ